MNRIERRRDGRKTGCGGGSKSSTRAKSQDKEILFRVRGEMTQCKGRTGATVREHSSREERNGLEWEGGDTETVERLTVAYSSVPLPLLKTEPGQEKEKGGNGRAERKKGGKLAALTHLFTVAIRAGDWVGTPSPSFS